MKLQNQVALIIGGARGIGETIAHNSSKEGASLVLVDLEKMKTELDAVAQAVNQNGGKAVAITADCSDDRHVNKLVDETVRRFGKIDVLVNSAGFRGPLVAVTEISDKEFDDVILYNLKLVFLCCRAVLKQMVKQKSGSIVSISGTAGREGIGDAGLAVRRQVGRGWPDANYREGIWPAWHPRQHHLSRRHGRTRPARNVRPARQELGHDRRGP